MARFKTVTAKEEIPEAALPIARPGIRKDFFFLGKSFFEVRYPDGTKFHYKVKSQHSDGWDKPSFWLLVNHDNKEAGFWGYIGVLKENGQIKSTSKSQYLKGTPEFDVAQWAINVVFSGDPVPDGYHIGHMGKCGVCTRMLDAGKEINRGICDACVKRIASGDDDNEVFDAPDDVRGEWS